MFCVCMTFNIVGIAITSFSKPVTVTERSKFRVVINYIESSREENIYAYPLSKASHAGEKVEKCNFWVFYMTLTFDLDPNFKVKGQ